MIHIPQLKEILIINNTYHISFKISLKKRKSFPFIVYTIQYLLIKKRFLNSNLVYCIKVTFVFLCQHKNNKSNKKRSM